MRILFFAAIASAVGALAQTNVEIAATSSRVTLGETLKASAAARDANGNMMNVTFRWSSNNDTVASVSADGTITPRALGIARIRATTPNNVWSETQIQILPGSVTIDPPSVDLIVGQSQEFKVTFRDAAGKDIANVPVTWSVLTGVGFTSNAASVLNGRVRALTEGDLIVRARYVYNTATPGFQAEIYANARLTIRPPRHYRSERVLRPESPPDVRFRYKNGQMFTASNGQLLFLASLNGWSSGIGLIDENGAPAMLAYAGQPGITQSTYVYDFSNISMNRRGDIIAQGSMIGSNNVLWRGDRNGLRPVVWENSTYSGFTTTNSHRYSRLALGPDGSTVFQANFRDGDPPVNYNGIFRMNPDASATRQVAANYDPWPELGGLPTFDGDTIAAGPNDTVYFSAYNGARRGLYRQTGFSAPQKIVVTGDTLLGSTVASFFGWPLYYVSEEGDVTFGVTLANNQSFFLLLPGGDLSKAKSLRVTGWSGVYGANENGVLALISPLNKAYGMYVWKGDETREIFVPNRSQVDGGVIQSVLSATFDTQGRITAMVQTDKNPWVIARFNGNSAPVLLKDGDPYQGDAPSAAWGLPQGGKSANFQIITGGANGSVFEYDGGGFKPVAIPGQRLAPTQVLTGIATWNSRRGPDGAIYLTSTSGYGIARVANGKTETVSACNRRSDEGVVLGCAYEVRVNAGGAMLSTQGSDKSDTRLALLTGATAKTVVTNSANPAYVTSVEGLGPVVSWSEQVLDNNGRVLAILRNARGAFGLFVWTDGTWRKIALQDETLDRWLALNFATLKAVGDSFYFRVQVPGGGWAIYMLGPGAATPRIVLDVDEVMANGVMVNTAGLYDVNNNGDIVFQASGFGQTSYAVKLSSGDLKHVYTNNTVTADGDILWRLVDLDIRDDGTVWSLFVSLWDEPVVYRSTPE